MIWLHSRNQIYAWNDWIFDIEHRHRKILPQNDHKKVPPSEQQIMIARSANDFAAASYIMDAKTGSCQKETRVQDRAWLYLKMVEDILDQDRDRF